MRIGFEELLDPLERSPMNDWLVFAWIPAAGMAGLAQVSAVLQ